MTAEQTMRQHPNGLYLPLGLPVPNGLPPGVGPTDYALKRGRHRRRPGSSWWAIPIAGAAAKTFVAYNGTAGLTAAGVLIAVTTSAKTNQQLKTSSTRGIRVIEWGVSFDAVVSTPIKCELIDTAAINATVTTYASTDVLAMNGPNDEATETTLGTSAGGFLSSGEGTITAARVADYQLVQQTYLKQFPLGREFEVPVSHILRVRLTGSASNTPNALTYIVWEE